MGSQLRDSVDTKMLPSLSTYQFIKVRIFSTLNATKSYLRHSYSKFQATKVLPAIVEANSSPLKAILTRPIANTLLFQSEFRADMIHFFQPHTSILEPFSHQEFTVQWNVMSLENIFQRTGIP
jgi:hypothetical protein